MKKPNLISGSFDTDAVNISGLNISGLNRKPHWIVSCVAAVWALCSDADIGSSSDSVCEADDNADDNADEPEMVLMKRRFKCESEVRRLDGEVGQIKNMIKDLIG